MSGKVKVSETNAKSILNRSRIPGVKFAINPYIGCQHGCIYCYARFMRRYTGHMNEEWGCFVNAKVNAADILEKQLWRKRNSPREIVLLSSVTDAYQPVERRYNLTRRCLELLKEFDYPVSILTKSHLVVRDSNLLSHHGESEVGVTVITLEESVRRVFESGAPSARKRLDALQNIADQGIRTYGFIGPVLPYLSEPSLEDLVRQLGDIGVEYVLVDRLNVKSGIRPIIEKALKEHFPDKTKAVLDALQPRSSYYDMLRSKTRDQLSEVGIDAQIIF